MIVITEAAPGLVPHSAVVPGSTCQRVISHPIVLEIATTATTPTVKRNQWLSTSPTIDSGTILAIRQPTMPCATTKGCSGGRTLPPPEANTIAASSGPSISAAGACSHNRRAARPADSATRIAHCGAFGSPPSHPGRSGTGSSATVSCRLC